MNILVLQVVHGVFFGRRTNVAVSIEVALHDSIHASHEREASNIKLATLIQQGIVDVLLQNHGAVASCVGVNEASNLGEL